MATNAHVARDEGSLATMLSDGQRLEGEVVYIDEDLDIARVQVPSEGFPLLALAPGNLHRWSIGRQYPKHNPATQSARTESA